MEGQIKTIGRRFIAEIECDGKLYQREFISLHRAGTKSNAEDALVTFRIEEKTDKDAVIVSVKPV